MGTGEFVDTIVMTKINNSDLLSFCRKLLYSNGKRLWSEQGVTFNVELGLWLAATIDERISFHEKAGTNLNPFNVA
jgi:hypothetical protein